MKILRSSSKTVAFIVAGAAAMVLVTNSVDAGPKFDPKLAKGGLPECMAKLNNTALEANAVETSDNVGVPQTGQTEIYVGGDDGDLQKGVPLPIPRFTDNLNGTVTDNLTGLIWTKNANLSVGETNWEAALNVCYYLGDDGVDLTDDSLPGDWRLPNIRELQSLLDWGQFGPALSIDDPLDPPFDDLQFSDLYTYYWSSTTFAGVESHAWAMGFFNGYVNIFHKETSNHYVWCVREAE